MKQVHLKCFNNAHNLADYSNIHYYEEVDVNDYIILEDAVNDLGFFHIQTNSIEEKEILYYINRLPYTTYSEFLNELYRHIQ